MAERGGLLVCLPHAGRRDERQLERLLSLQKESLRSKRSVSWTNPGSSLLTYNFNDGWAIALNLRDEGKVTHFLLWHADIVPQGDDWLETLYLEMARVEADVLSVISPIKNQNGLTSTARDTDPWRPIRYTMTEILARPLTWTEPDLLVNTGLLLIDLQGAWIERDPGLAVCFTMRDQVARNPETGRWEPDIAPEDWGFSRHARAAGARIWVTRAVMLDHWGEFPYPNHVAWGAKVDEGNLAHAQRRTAAALVAAAPHAQPNGEGV